MNFEVYKKDGITVFKLNEKRLDTNISGLVKSEFTTLLKIENVEKFIVDLSQVENCDSSGLSALLVANRIINSNGGNIIITSTSEKVLQLIRITQLNRVLPVRASVEEAINELIKK